MIDLLDAPERAEAWNAALTPVPVRADAVTVAEMRRWVQQSLNERSRRAERQLQKDWKRTTPHKAARVVEVGNALLRMLREMEGRP